MNEYDDKQEQMRDLYACQTLERLEAIFKDSDEIEIVLMHAYISLLLSSEEHPDAVDEYLEYWAMRYRTLWEIENGN